MKKNHSRNSGRESEASILGNDREREFPLTPALENTSDHVAGEVYPMFSSKEKILPCPKEIVEEKIIDHQVEDHFHYHEIMYLHASL